MNTTEYNIFVERPVFCIMILALIWGVPLLCYLFRHPIVATMWWGGWSEGGRIWRIVVDYPKGKEGIVVVLQKLQWFQGLDNESHSEWSSQQRIQANTRQEVIDAKIELRNKVHRWTAK